MLEAAIIRHRTVAALAWSVVACCVLVSGIARLPELAVATWLGTIIVLVITARLDRTVMPEEQLVRARIYRAVAAAVFGVGVVGCVVGLLPSAEENSRLLSIFFGGTALLAYRALVARGPRPTVLLAAIASFASGPAALVLLNTCKCGHQEAAWTELASHVLFVGALVLISMLVAVALVAFRRRTSDLPDMRVR